MSTATLVVHGWSTECGGCGYGGGGWRNSPALKDKPILTPDSTECPGCGARFIGAEDDFPKGLSPAQMLLRDD